MIEYLICSYYHAEIDSAFICKLNLNRDYPTVLHLEPFQCVFTTHFIHVIRSHFELRIFIKKLQGLIRFTEFFVAF
jgi:hypothetical protein